MGQGFFRIILFLSVATLLAGCDAGRFVAREASGALNAVVRGDPPEQASAQGETDRFVCIAALFGWPDKGYWPAEAERRGFSPDICSALLKRDDPNNKRIADPNAARRPYSDTLICGSALDPLSEVPMWNYGDASSLSDIKEAKARGFTPGSCSVLRGRTDPSAPKSIANSVEKTEPAPRLKPKPARRPYSDTLICGSALDPLSEVPMWNYGDAATLGSIMEAKARGFTPDSCSVLLGRTNPPIPKRIVEPVEKISPAPKLEPRPKGPDPALVRRIQRDLAKLGLDPGPADGVMGSKTRSAITVFEAYVSLPVTGEPTEKLHAAIRATIGLLARGKQRQKERELRPVGSGTGFAVSASNLYITNHHVVAGCEAVSIKATKASVEASDPKSDLALLKLPGNAKSYARFRSGRGIRTGENIVVMGFPLQDVLSSDLNVTTGNVSSLAGLRGNRQYIQISAPVQEGNSGGPVFDTAGNVVGVVAAKLNALLEIKKGRSIPQNVNFAISEGTVRAFLDAQNVSYDLAASTEKIQTADMVAQAQKYVKLIECWK